MKNEVVIMQSEEVAQHEEAVIAIAIILKIAIRMLSDFMTFKD
jgi:hypothetical protein